MSEEKQKLKMAVIAGAGNAIAYKERNPNAPESEVMQFVTSNMSKILREIEEED